MQGLSLLKFVAVAMLILANAFFVAAEFALVSIRETRIEQMLAARVAGARAVRRLQRGLDELLPAVQLGVTLCSLALGWLGEPLAASILMGWFGKLPHANLYAQIAAVTLGFALITYFHVVVGELVPKSLALRRAEALAVAVAPPMLVFMALARPAVRLLKVSAAATRELSMERRSLLKTLSAAAAAGAAVSLGQGRTLSAEAASGVAATMGGGGPLAQARDAARRGMPPLKITNVKVIATAPSSSNWTIVKVETSEPGLYGLGSATHQEIPQAAQAYIETRLKPFVVGKNCDEIEDIWQSAYVQQYFRSGPESNNALSGIDGALWDILGKRLGVPVYQLLGGKVRAAVPLYGHASSMDLTALEDQVRKYMENGYQVRSESG